MKFQCIFYVYLADSPHVVLTVDMTPFGRQDTEGLYVQTLENRCCSPTGQICKSYANVYRREKIVSMIWFTITRNA